MSDSTHECPAPGCQRRVPYQFLACSAHWYMLPQDLRHRLWRAWNRGTAAEHAEVRQECVRWYEENLAAA